MSESRYERGLRTQAELDPDIGQGLHDHLRDIAPDFAEITISVGFGDIASRPGLSLDRRAMVVVSALATLGADRQLRVWIGMALNAGVGPDEIVESLMQLAPYAGWPVLLMPCAQPRTCSPNAASRSPPATERGQERFSHSAGQS
jgi:4-carboxymuconolactone decarboxylase